MHGVISVRRPHGASAEDEDAGKVLCCSERKPGDVALYISHRSLFYSGGGCIQIGSKYAFVSATLDRMEVGWSGSVKPAGAYDSATWQSGR